MSGVGGSLKALISQNLVREAFIPYIGWKLEAGSTVMVEVSVDIDVA